MQQGLRLRRPTPMEPSFIFYYPNGPATSSCNRHFIINTFSFLFFFFNVAYLYAFASAAGDMTTLATPFNSSEREIRVESKHLLPFPPFSTSVSEFVTSDKFDDPALFPSMTPTMHRISSFAETLLRTQPKSPADAYFDADTCVQCHRRLHTKHISRQSSRIHGTPPSSKTSKILSEMRRNSPNNRRMLLESPSFNNAHLVNSGTTKLDPCWRPGVEFSGGTVTSSLRFTTPTECVQQCVKINRCFSVTYDLRTSFCSFFPAFAILKQSTTNQLSAVIDQCFTDSVRDLTSEPFQSRDRTEQNRALQNMPMTSQRNNTTDFPQRGLPAFDRFVHSQPNMKQTFTTNRHLQSAQPTADSFAGIERFDQPRMFHDNLPNDLLYKRAVPSQTAFQFVGEGISQKECEQLCDTGSFCKSYRWTSSSGQCELEYNEKYSTERSASASGASEAYTENQPSGQRSEMRQPPSVYPVPVSAIGRVAGSVNVTRPLISDTRMADSSSFFRDTTNTGREIIGPLLNPVTQQPFDSLEYYNEGQHIYHQGDFPYMSSERLPLTPSGNAPNNILKDVSDTSAARPYSNAFESTTTKSDRYAERTVSNTLGASSPEYSDDTYTDPSTKTSYGLRLPLLNSPLFDEIGLGRFFPGLLSSSSSSVKAEEGYPSFMQSAASALKTFQSVLAAGDTVMKTFPVADLVRAGQQMSNSGLLNLRNSAGVKGGVPVGVKDKAVGATRPPKGVEPPEISCYPQGMRCCVPQGAVAHYQTNPPKLNGVDSRECTAHYVSNINQLCVTVMYERNDCNQIVIATDTTTVYRNVMVIPDKTMNNAICECTLPKRFNEQNSSAQGDDPGSNHMIPASARWQYSRGAMEKDIQTKQRFHETAGKLGSAAKTMFFVGDVLTKPYADPETAYMADGAASFIDSLTHLGDELQQQRASVQPAPSTRPKRGGP